MIRDFCLLFLVATSCRPIMRFNTALTSALVSSASIMGYAHAEEAENKPDSSSVAEKPIFTVCWKLSLISRSLPRLSSIVPNSTC